MIVEVNHPTYGKSELNVARVIAICPQKRWILFEDCYWPLNQADFDKVADVWRKMFDEELKCEENV